MNGESIEDILNDHDHRTGNLEKAAARVADQCREGLREMGIRAIVSWRVKARDSLRGKLERKAAEHPDGSPRDHYERMGDLAGVRIALYFPDDVGRVGDFIRGRFDEREVVVKPGPDPSRPKYEPYTPLFSGYHATHLVVRLRPDGPGSDGPLAQYNVEVQIASVLMHAWSEVEHDLVYKPYTGELSPEELAILDQLNGLVLSGEIALRSLHKAMTARIGSSTAPFCNSYEMANYIANKLSEDWGGSELSHNEHLGRTFLLYRFLMRVEPDWATVRFLDPHLDRMIRYKNVQPHNQKPAAVFITDSILLQRPDLYVHYMESRFASNGDTYNSMVSIEARYSVTKHPKSLVDEFLRHFATFEQIFFRHHHPSRTLEKAIHVYPADDGWFGYGLRGSPGVPGLFENRAVSEAYPNHSSMALARAQGLRNQYLYGGDPRGGGMPQDNQIHEVTHYMRGLLDLLTTMETEYGDIARQVREELLTGSSSVDAE